LVGTFTKRQLTTLLTSRRLTFESVVRQGYSKEFKLLTVNDPVSRLSKAFTRHQFVVVQDGQNLSIAVPDVLLDSFLQNN
jgi:hypothetical protein